MNANILGEFQICIIVPLNFRAVSKMRYGAGIIKLQAMDRKTRKFLTMNGAHTSHEGCSGKTLHEKIRGEEDA